MFYQCLLLRPPLLPANDRIGGAKRKGGFKGVIHDSCPSPRICGHYLSAVLRHFTSILMLTPEGTFSP